MKELPRLYKNENIEYRDNNKKICFVKENIIKEEVLVGIENIFSSSGYPFDKKVIIKTKDKMYKTYLVAREKDIIKTINDEVIDIKDIISIERL